MTCFIVNKKRNKIFDDGYASENLTNVSLLFDIYSK